MILSPMDQPVNNVPAQTSKPVPQQELPHLVVEEPKRGVFGFLGIITLSLMLLGIPIGLFLVSQQTQLEPQAAVIEPEPEAVSGIFLESQLSFEANGGIIPVDVYVKSPVDQINLVSAQLKFDPGFLSVEMIATDAAELNMQPVFNKWVEVSFDNAKGSASVISGLPTPGLKTGGPNEDKVYLATVHLRPKKAGPAILQVIPVSQVLRNSDSNNIFRTGSDLALNLTSGSEAAASTSPTRSNTDKEPLVVVTSPAAAVNYSYFKPMQIAWSSFNVDRISQINLFVNNELLGPIAQNLEAQVGKFDWIPKDTLALHYIQPNNTYEIEVVGVSEEGEVARIRSAPFGILGTEEVVGAPPNPATFGQNQLGVKDVSRALSKYLVVPLEDGSVDLNKDGVVNDLDLFLIRMNLLERGVIR